MGTSSGNCSRCAAMATSSRSEYGYASCPCWHQQMSQRPCSNAHFGFATKAMAVTETYLVSHVSQIVERMSEPLQDGCIHTRCIALGIS